MNDNTEQKNNARAVQHRRGTAAQNDAFTGLPGEITVDLDNKTIRVHDGTTAGGTALARQSTLDAADYVVAWQTPTAENNYTWYRKYKSGWVEQGGQSVDTAEFPIPFSDDDYTIQSLFSTDRTNGNNVYPGDKTRFGFSILQAGPGYSGGSTNVWAVNWTVCGFILV